MTRSRPAILNHQGALEVAVQKFGDHAWCWTENGMWRMSYVVGILNGAILMEYGRGKNWEAALVAAEEGYRRLTQ